MSWFSNFISGDWFGAAAVAGATVAGAVISADANKEAARMASDASQRQADEIRRGNTLAQQRYDAVQEQTAPAVARTTAMMNQGETLTDAQREQIDEARRVTTNQLSVSPLRGSGRATVAAIRKVESDLTNDLTQQNRTRADQATRELTSQNFAATNAAAGLDAATGRAVGAAAMNEGVINANATTATGSLRGQVIGDIGTIINDAWKETRRSGYGTDRAKKPGEDDAKKLTMAGAQ